MIKPTVKRGLAMGVKRNQQGFSHLHIILLILLLLIIGLVGWRVWAARSDDSADEPTSSEVTEEAEVVELNYVQPPSNSYKAALPEGWVSGSCPDSPDILFMAPTADDLGKCNTESGGTVAIGRSDGNTGYGADYYAADAYYGGAVHTPVTIDGIEGYKVTYTVATDDGLGYPPIGTEVVQYVLFDGTHTYSIVYTRFAGDADLTAAAQSIAESFDKL